MRADNRVNDIDRGALIYSTAPISHRFQIIIIVLNIIVWILPIYIIIYPITNPDNSPRYESFIETILASICLATLILIGLYLLLYVFVVSHLEQKFKIYENGMTKFVLFSIRNRVGEFIPFSKMRSFSISDDKSVCSINIIDHKSPVTWDADNPQHIILIANTLRSKNIPENK